MVRRKMEIDGVEIEIVIKIDKIQTLN